MKYLSIPSVVKIILSFTFLGMLLSCNSERQKTLLAEGASLEVIAEDFSFTEGPTADKEGNIYFTDQPNNKIYKYSIDGELSVFMDNAGRSNGLYYDNGFIWACADAYNQLWKIDLDKKVDVVLNADSSQTFNGPNDVWVHQKGYIYFTDPLYQRPYWGEPHDTLKYQGLYFMPDENASPILVDSLLIQPNGIVGDSKNNLLYVADIGDGKTYSYAIDPDGALTNKMQFVEQGSDGMTLDEEGNLYLTGDGVDIYNTEGEHIQHLDVPEKWTANICFGGANNDEIFITASKGLYKLKMNVKGVR
ncbi:SMP-30/gluconolactonase/LRE family protein [Marivirga atlantica]|uniref:SMP-30/gluconolactonase/LRE family protein n=1 Tax=Marivirga atlantica TaxID=1548457 RepID=A0A937DIN4_9BACT|nr:SMP-30/gluconolactonase/LRE family protein [Marivirga atlantica]MBL0763984.1 SMP-30/gluconolactonase/LRE family protein [Marivirga atlantica]